jgi:hypothetical protein
VGRSEGRRRGGVCDLEGLPFGELTQGGAEIVQGIFVSFYRRGVRGRPWREDTWLRHESHEEGPVRVLEGGDERREDGVDELRPPRVGWRRLGNES